MRVAFIYVWDLVVRKLIHIYTQRYHITMEDSVDLGIYVRLDYMPYKVNENSLTFRPTDEQT